MSICASDRLESAREIVSEFFKNVDPKDREQPFHLGRKLKRLEGNVEDFEEIVLSACAENGIRGVKREEFWTDLYSVWDEIRFPDRGVDPLKNAYELARKTPIEIPADIYVPTPAHRLLCSIAYYLAEYNLKGRFILSGRHLIKLLRRKKRTVYHMIKWLEHKARYITCVDDTVNWNPKKGRRKARYFMLTEHAHKETETIKF